jgi:hypothetical protein
MKAAISLQAGQFVQGAKWQFGNQRASNRRATLIVPPAYRVRKAKQDRMHVCIADASFMPQYYYSVSRTEKNDGDPCLLPWSPSLPLLLAPLRGKRGEGREESRVMKERKAKIKGTSN